ncbi:hypothetical protein IVB18_18665 [Bradyrhizobium sp. 186]|uniref:hypothetical protein n=1 Tax=Bradyrhizobium sp. 186 TaxID=2782654 RepID=UPI0020006DB4|nr:hypothetical protein [Bradyrhizobium sp. 186]UPK39075.1 hypothetical protein IVB18_18665 [Bradyrhizobium sp. 186]
MLWGGDEDIASIVADEPMERPMQKLNDLSRSPSPLDPNGTLIAVIELSLSSWLVAGIVPGVERQPLKKLAVDESALLKLLHRWREEAAKAGHRIKRIAEEGNAQPATSLGGSEAAAGVGGTTDNGGGLDVEIEEYGELLAAIGRSAEDDKRISVHESGHALAARLLGKPLGGATIAPDPNGNYGGLVWGPRHRVAYGKHDDRDDVPELCDTLRDLMPQDGEPRDAAADVYLHVLNRCIELVAASVAERMLLDGEPVPSVSDIEHTIKYASMICRSAEAVERFIRLCETMADDLLRPHRDVLGALAAALRIRRTLDGTEIDKIIWDFEAHKALAAEHRRRADWRKAEVEAERFRAQCVHIAAAALSSSVPDRMP